MRMAMANAYHCMSSIEVKIFLAFVVPYIAAFAFNDVYVK